MLKPLTIQIYIEEKVGLEWKVGSETVTVLIFDDIDIMDFVDIGELKIDELSVDKMWEVIEKSCGKEYINELFDYEKEEIRKAIEIVIEKFNKVRKALIEK
jgi:homoserine acetyltransferase